MYNSCNTKVSYSSFKSKKLTAYYKINEDIGDLDLVYIASGGKSFKFSASETEYPLDVSMQYMGRYKNGCQNGIHCHWRWSITYI